MWFIRQALRVWKWESPLTINEQTTQNLTFVLVRISDVLLRRRVYSWCIRYRVIDKHPDYPTGAILRSRQVGWVKCVKCSRVSVMLFASQPTYQHCAAQVLQRNKPMAASLWQGGEVVMFVLRIPKEKRRMSQSREHTGKRLNFLGLDPSGGDNTDICVVAPLREMSDPFCEGMEDMSKRFGWRVLLSFFFSFQKDLDWWLLKRDQRNHWESVFFFGHEGESSRLPGLWLW